MRGVLHMLGGHVATSAIGLDVGSATVRAAQLRRRGKGWSISALGSYRCSDGHEPLDREAPYFEKAAQWLKRLDLRGRSVVAGLSQPDIELHAMELPRSPAGTSPDAEANAARWEIERLMSIEEGAAETAHWSLPESRQMRTTAMGVAAPKSRLDAVIGFCRAASMDCLRIDAAPCALARFGTLYRALSFGEGDVWGVLDLGARMSRLVMCVDQTPVLARAFEYGGTTWTQRLSEALSVSRESAERHKCDHGIANLGGGGRGGSSGAVGEMIFNVLRMDLDGIILEVERSYRYVLQCFTGRPAGPLILVGGGGGLRNLDELLSARVGVEVLVPDGRSREAGLLDFDRVGQSLREPLGNFACAIGLAVAEV